MRLVLASTSPVRSALLAAAGVPHETMAPRVDEEALRAALGAEGVSPRDMADALAEAKALKVSGRVPGALVVGCDQILELDGAALGKAESVEEARAQLLAMRGRSHRLISAAVAAEDARPVWRHVAEARLTMRDFSDAFLDGYLDRNWDGLRGCVGAYKLEEEGVRLFDRIEGDYFTVLGLPLVPLLSWLSARGAIAG